MTRKSATESLMARYPVNIVAPGTALFEREDRADLVYYVHQGEFALSSCTPNGRETELGRVQPGDLLGIEAICSPHYFTTVRCTRRARISAVSRPELLRLINAEPEFAEYVLERTLHALCDVREMFLNVTCRSALQRVALHLSREDGADDVILLPWGSRQQLAGKLGMTQETLSRTLRRLAELGVIQLGRGRVTIIDRGRLLEIGAADSSDAVEYHA